MGASRATRRRCASGGTRPRASKGSIRAISARLTGRMEQPIAGPRLAVSTPVFEGPLELLLALAEREELDIFQVPLARVTDGYPAEIAQREVADPQEMAEFLWIAARLLLLKSIRLLPGETPTDEEADLLGWEEDVRQRLEEYRAYKAMAQDLMQRAEQEVFAFPPAARPVEAGGPGAPLAVDLLVAAFNSGLARLPPRPGVSHRLTGSAGGTL